jgi:ribonucleoside-triphosphate reductase
VVSHGKVWNDLTYGDLEDKVHLFAGALLDEYMKGDAVGKMFNFPKPEVVQRTRYWNDKNFEDIMLKAAQLSAKFGSTYYDNMIPAYRGGEDGVSCFQCCAYSFSEDGTSESFQKKIHFEDGAHFSMGGMQVVTLNMPRLAYKSGGDEARLLEILRETMETAKQALMLKYSLMKRQFDRGLIPFASQRPKGAPTAVDIDNLSSTIGFVGVNEMVEHMTGYQLHEDPSAQKLALKVVIEMDKIRKEFADSTGMKFSIARTPAESAAQRFAVSDMIHYTKFARELVKGDLEAALPRYRETRDVPIYYTNGAHVNVSSEVPLYDRLAIEQRFFPILKGGDIFHIWLGEINPDPEALLKLNRKLAQSWIGYWSHTKDITMCRTCGYVGGGLNAKCPMCGSTSVKNYSRITGYYQDVSSWNAAKKQELIDRHRVRISS